MEHEHTNFESGASVEIENQSDTLKIDFERRKVVIQHRYEWLHIINDFLLALWFLVGSIFFFYEKLVYAGTWLFVLGSAQMMIGPVIRTAHKLHLKSINDSNLHF